MHAHANSLRSRKNDSQARAQLAVLGYDYALPAVLSLTRDNRLYDRDDVKQQMWIYVLEAIDGDKGMGDILYYIKWYTINRIRDWIGMTVRRHAYMVCEDCNHRMPIKPRKHRVCTECGAGPERIESKSFIDAAVDHETTMRVVVDDYTAVFVEDFLSTLKDDRDRAILLGYVADVDRAQLAVRHGVSTGRISQIVNRIQIAYSNYAAA
jgi:RNA polymerase sigma factor (sigma-70 family)